MSEGKEDEDVEAQIDRLNEAIAKTLEDARKAALGTDISPRDPSHSLTSRGRLSFSHFLPGLVPGGLESGEGSEYSLDSELQEYLYTLEVELERALMKLEDWTSRAVQQRKKVVLSPIQLSSLSETLRLLENGHMMELQLGEIQLQIVCQVQENQERPTISPIPTINQTNSPQPVLSNELSSPEIVSSLQDRIEGLLIPDSPLNPDPIDDIPPETLPFQHESDLSALREQVHFLNPEGEEETAIRRELDKAEEISMRVASGQDPSKLYVQLALVEKGLLQLRGRKASQNTAKIVSGLTAKLNSEEESRKLHQSKARILAEIQRKAEFQPYRVPLPPPKPVIVTLETVSSAMDSPAASRIIDFDFLLDKRERESELRKRLEAVEERVDKLRNLLKEQNMRLQRYRDTEKQLIMDKTRLKTSERRLNSYKNTLETQEKLLFARERELAVKIDNLREEAAELTGKEEALEYLALKAETLEQENHRLFLENTLIALKRTEIESEKEEIVATRRLLEGQNRQLMRERETLEGEKTRVAQSKTELEDFLPLLRRYQAGN